jgi:two-component system, sensor histidine kinase and response regulator
MMGGEIGVESKAGEGSDFFFTVMLTKKTDGDESFYKLDPSEMKSDLSVLVIDDNEIVQKSIAEMLKDWNINYTILSSCHECESIKANFPQRYDLALMDSAMLLDDQTVSLQKLYDILPLNDNGKIVVLSSNLSAIQSGKLRNVGIKYFVNKPVLQSDLKIVCSKDYGNVEPASLFKDSTEGQNKDAINKEEGSSIKILLAEDQPINRKIVIGLLKRYNWQIISAENGEEAVEKYNHEPFDLVLMDVQMPRMDGFDATRHIREQEINSEKHIPIIAMTAHAMKGDKEKCLEAGMDYYITKPIDSQELIGLIKKIIAV